MKYIDVNIQDLIVYERGVSGEDLITTYGDKLAEMVYEYCNTSNPIVFDKNKDYIHNLYIKYNNFDNSIVRRHAELFFYRLKKIMYLNSEFLKNKKWNNPVVIRDSIFGDRYLVQGGIDRYHVMKNLNVKSYNFLHLSNIEFSEDFAPRLALEFTPDTQFTHLYNERTHRFEFLLKTNFVDDPNFDKNLRKWLKRPYIEGATSGLVNNPNAVTLRDYHISKMKRKRKGR